MYSLEQNELDDVDTTSAAGCPAERRMAETVAVTATKANHCRDVRRGRDSMSKSSKTLHDDPSLLR